MSSNALPVLAKRVSRLPGIDLIPAHAVTERGEGVKKIKLKNMHNKNLADDSPVAFSAKKG